MLFRADSNFRVRWYLVCIKSKAFNHPHLSNQDLCKYIRGGANGGTNCTSFTNKLFFILKKRNLILFKKAVCLVYISYLFLCPCDWHSTLWREQLQLPQCADATAPNCLLATRVFRRMPLALSAIDKQEAKTRMTRFLGTAISGKSCCFVDFLKQHGLIIAGPVIQSFASAADVFSTETRFMNTHTASLFLHALSCVVQRKSCVRQPRDCAKTNEWRCR